MKNKKGFTIVELGVSICLISVISFLLFQMITSVKKIYTTGDLKTTLLTKQAIMTKKIYDDFETKMITSITNCDTWQNSCLQFVFNDNTRSTLLVDPLNHIISYNNYTINYQELDDTIQFGELTLNEYTDFFTIKIPMNLSTIEGDYGIQITHQHTNKILNNYTGTGIENQIVIPIVTKEGTKAQTNITYDGKDYWLKIYDAKDLTLNSLLSSQIRYLKIDTCSNSNFIGNAFELKTGKNISRWCQSNNVYTQLAGDYMHIAGQIHTVLGKNTFQEALQDTGILKDTTLELKVNEFINRYTFKAR